nr:hypothetical protein [uncultured Marinifilum sp.]
MNKLLKSLVFGISLLLINCESIQNTITINHSNTYFPIIVRMTKEDNSIIGIRFPNKITVENKSLFKESFVKIEYRYKNIPLERNYGIGLFEQENGKLIKTSNNKKKTISSKGSIEFVYYTRHFVDSTKSIQLQFKPYIDKMVRLGKDTLHIGTVDEFKQTHKELFESLTKNDSISIRFLDSSTESGLGERIAVPVKW